MLNKDNFTLTGESGTILRKTDDVHLLEYMEIIQNNLVN